MIQVRINDGESPDRLITRFNKRVQASRILPFLQKRRYWKKRLSKTKTRQAAVSRERYRAQRERMKYY